MRHSPSVVVHDQQSHIMSVKGSQVAHDSPAQIDIFFSNGLDWPQCVGGEGRLFYEQAFHWSHVYSSDAHGCTPPI